jgi:hypothetical protein
VIQKAAQRKIQGFGAKNIKKTRAYKEHLERTEWFAELEHLARLKRLEELKEKQQQLAYRDRKTSSISDSSNYNTPPGSPAPSASRLKGKLKRNIDQVTNTLSFSFWDLRLTRSSFKKKEGAGWPPKS